LENVRRSIQSVYPLLYVTTFICKEFLVVENRRLVKKNSVMQVIELMQN